MIQESTEYIITIKGDLSNFWLETLAEMVPDIHCKDGQGDRTHIYARLTPETKLQLIKTLTSLDKPIVHIQEV